MRTARNPSGTTDRNATRYWRWEDAGGLVAPAVALVLWVAVVAAIAAPLGAALARIDGERSVPVARTPASAPCPLPPGALASAARPGDAACR